MSSHTPAEAGPVASFVFVDPSSELTYTFFESPVGLACNYSMGVEHLFSVRLAHNGGYESGLDEVEAVLLLAGVVELPEHQGASVTKFPQAEHGPKMAAA